MLINMRSTFIIDDEVFRRAKQQAAAQGTTLSAFVSQALRDALDSRDPEPPTFEMITFGAESPRVAHEPADFAAALEDEDVENSC